VRAVVFDIGGVLLDWDPRHLYRRLFEDRGEMERFLAEVCTPQWHAQHDRGVPFSVSCARLAERHPEYAELIWAWGKRSEEMIAGPIEGTVAVLDDLQVAGIPCYGLTNMEAETYPLRRERYGFLRALAGTVVSSSEGLIKPDRRIFELLLDRFGLQARSTLFIDDSPANVAAARELGIQAVRFASPPQLRAELERRGLLAPQT
jgi:2-haloacid dehalogenase